MRLKHSGHSPSATWCLFRVSGKCKNIQALCSQGLSKALVRAVHFGSDASRERRLGALKAYFTAMVRDREDFVQEILCDDVPYAEKWGESIVAGNSAKTLLRYCLVRRHCNSSESTGLYLLSVTFVLLEVRWQMCASVRTLIRILSDKSGDCDLTLPLRL